MINCFSAEQQRVWMLYLLPVFESWNIVERGNGGSGLFLSQFEKPTVEYQWFCNGGFDKDGNKDLVVCSNSNDTYNGGNYDTMAA